MALEMYQFAEGALGEAIIVVMISTNKVSVALLTVMIPGYCCNQASTVCKDTSRTIIRIGFLHHIHPILMRSMLKAKEFYLQLTQTNITSTQDRAWHAKAKAAIIQWLD
jgi:hypothetical protein